MLLSCTICETKIQVHYVFIRDFHALYMYVYSYRQFDAGIINKTFGKYL